MRVRVRSLVGSVCEVSCGGKLAVVFYICLSAGEEIGMPFFEFGAHTSFKDMLCRREVFVV